MYGCHLINNTSMLIGHTHITVQVVYYHYVLTPCMECLWNVKHWHICLKQEDQNEQTKKELWH